MEKLNEQQFKEFQKALNETANPWGAEACLNKDGSTTTKVFNESGGIVKEITVPAKSIQQISQPKGIDESEIPDEYKQILEKRLQAQREQGKPSGDYGRHKIKTSTGREISLEKEENSTPGDWIGNLAKILSSPESLNNLCEHFEKMSANSDLGKEIWEKQKSAMYEMDEILEKESEFLEKTLKEGSVINGLFVVKNYMEKLLVLMDAVEKFLDMEISSAPNYEAIRSPYGRSYLNVSESITEIENLIENVIQERKRLLQKEEESKA